MAAAANPVPKASYPKIPFDSTPAPKGMLPWWAVQTCVYRRLQCKLHGVEKDVLFYLAEMTNAPKRAPSDPLPWCSTALTIQEIAEECECAKSGAQAALRLLVEIGAATQVTPAEARKHGLPSRGSRTLRYKLNWERFPEITSEQIEEARDRLEPEEPATETENEEPEQEEAVEAPVIRHFVVHSTAPESIKFAQSFREIEFGASTTVKLTARSERGKVLLFAEASKEVSDRQIPAGRYNSTKQGQSTRAPAGTKAPESKSGRNPLNPTPIKVPAAPGGALAEACKAAGAVLGPEDEDLIMRTLKDLKDCPLEYFREGLADRIKRGPFDVRDLPARARESYADWKAGRPAVKASKPQMSEADRIAAAREDRNRRRRGAV